jgi:hypothetical protein
MDIQVAVLCDAATDNNSKLNILGTFDTIYAAHLPVTHPQCSIAIRMTFSKAEEGSHKVTLNFMDEDGKPVMPPIPAMPVEVAVPDETMFLSRNIIVNIQKLRFEKEGLYSIEIALDGRQERSIPLLVKVAPQLRASPPPQ